MLLHFSPCAREIRSILRGEGHYGKPGKRVQEAPGGGDGGDANNDNGDRNNDNGGDDGDGDDGDNDNGGDGDNDARCTNGLPRMRDGMHYGM